MTQISNISLSAIAKHMWKNIYTTKVLFLNGSENAATETDVCKWLGFLLGMSAML